MFIMFLIPVCLQSLLGSQFVFITKHNLDSLQRLNHQLSYFPNNFFPTYINIIINYFDKITI